VVWNHATRTHTVPPDIEASLNDEFRGLLEHLGVSLRHDRQQTVRCFLPEHPDRTPSLSVNPSRRVWHCHGCGARGGLRELRARANLTPRERSRVSVPVALARLAESCRPGADPLALVKAAAVEELRARTGRHKKDRTLSDNLARFLAAIHEQMREAESTSGVSFSVLDASRVGIPSGLWQHFMALRLDALGGKPILSVWVEVTLGESGRCARRFRGTGKGGAFRATEVTLRDCAYPDLGGERTELVRDRPPFRGMHNSEVSTPVRATVLAGLAASVPRSDSVSLHRRRAVALLLADLAYSTSVVLESNGRTSMGEGRTVGELVDRYGERVRRTIRAAEFFGWVDMPVRLADTGLVYLTPEGLDRLQTDVARATFYRNDLADRRAAIWAEQQRNLRELATLRARHVAQVHAVEGAPWVSCGRDRVRHVETGEVRELASLRV
jgi:hypothetical protein